MNITPPIKLILLTKYQTKCTIFSDIFDAIIFPPRTADPVQIACPQRAPRRTRKAFSAAERGQL